MKKFVLFSGILLCSFLTFAQNSYNYTDQVNQMVGSPNSPEAQAFAKYGDIPVNLYVGAPKVSIPLYSFNGREMNLPIGLTYDINARKVDDVASNVGASWNLNLGGRVSRMINGLSDHYFNSTGFAYSTLENSPGITRAKYLSYKDKLIQYASGYPNGITFTTPAEAEDFFEFLYDVSESERDISPDKYSINAMGLNDEVILDVENAMACIPLNNPNLKVSKFAVLDIVYWEVIDASGTKYYFGNFATEDAFENTLRENIGVDPIEGNYRTWYRSSWLLTKVISPNGKDTYTFEYDQVSEYWAAPIKTNNAHFTNSNPNVPPQEYDPESRYYIDQQFLARVKHNGNTIVEVGLADRDDLDVSNSRVKSLTIKDPFNSNNIINHFEFDNDHYFGNLSGSMEEKRLKLNKIFVAGQDYDPTDPNYEFKKEYSFEYESPELMPSRTSLDFDLLGFFNDKENTVLYPEVQYGTQSGDIMQGADRTHDFEKSKIGILTKVNYPTGGYSTFEYEPNQEEFIQGSTSNRTVATASVKNFFEFNDPSECGACCEAQAPTSGEIASTDINSFEISNNTNRTYDIAFSVYDKQGPDTNYRGYLVHSAQSNPNVTYEDICNDATLALYSFDAAPASGDTEEILDQILPIGFYKLIVVNLDDDTYEEVCALQGYDCSEVVLNIERETYHESTEIKEYPGIRVKSVSEYEEAGSIATKKSFKYEGLTENYIPKLYYAQNINYLDSNNQETGGLVHHRVSKPIMGSNPYITYDKVTESRVNPNSDAANFGYTTYEFYNDPEELSGTVPNWLPPYGNDFHMNIKKGTIKNQRIFDVNDNLLRTSESIIEPDPSGNQTFKSISTTDWAYNNVRFVMLYWQSGLVHFSLATGHMGGVNGNELVAPPCNTNNGCIDVLEQNVNSRVIPYVNYTYTQYPITAQGTSKQYLNGLETSTTTKTNFAPERGYFTRSTESGTSENDKTILREYTYPQDVPNESHMTNLIAEGRIASPVEVKTYQKEGTDPPELLNYQKTFYGSFNGKIFPHYMQSAKMNESLQTDVIFKDYEDGNLVEVSKSGDVPTLYVWGYNNQFPVARIEHNVPYSSLDSNLLGEINSATDEATLQSKLQTLRGLSVLSGALITTYTYKPHIGISTITDPRGDIISFHYDELNRLEYVKDKDGNRLSETEYNYRINY